MDQQIADCYRDIITADSNEINNIFKNYQINIYLNQVNSESNSESNSKSESVLENKEVCSVSVIEELQRQNFLRAGVQTPEEAIAVHKIALKLDFQDKIIPRWQHYWVKCCLSEKCDYVFAILGSKNLKKLIN